MEIVLAARRQGCQHRGRSPNVQLRRQRVGTKAKLGGALRARHLPVHLRQ